MGRLLKYLKIKLGNLIRNFAKKEIIETVKENRIVIDRSSFEQMILPDKIVIENQQIEKEDVTLELIQEIENHLYEGDYGRIELTYFGYMEYKKKKYLSHENSLVFQCEDGNSFMCYFDGKDLNVSVFYENRNNAGSLPSEEVPTVMFRGRKVSEQHVLYNRSILVKTLLELLNTGVVFYEIHAETMNNGFFSTQYFSNKNAFLKYKNLMGEFH